MCDVSVVTGIALPALIDMPLDLFRIWEAYAEKYPPGWRTEVQLAQLHASFLTANTDPKSSKKPPKAAELSPVLARFQEERERANAPKTQEEYAQMLMDKFSPWVANAN